jgi:hypothetical protein
MLGKDGTLCLPTNIILGYLADIARLPVTMPLDLLSTRMQTTTSGSLVARILKSNPRSDFTKNTKCTEIGH